MVEATWVRSRWLAWHFLLQSYKLFQMRSTSPARLALQCLRGCTKPSRAPRRDCQPASMLARASLYQRRQLCLCRMAPCTRVRSWRSRQRWRRYRNRQQQLRPCFPWPRSAQTLAHVRLQSTQLRAGSSERLWRAARAGRSCYCPLSSARLVLTVRIAARLSISSLQRTRRRSRTCEVAGASWSAASAVSMRPPHEASAMVTRSAMRCWRRSCALLRALSHVRCTM
mmetsp:Transcript_10985/g.45542  ORF Transcript_10985/g.45542 Transcript_10985/m.45542 type:complete len:226 (+) Transcript_10985:4594-5271(+)